MARFLGFFRMGSTIFKQEDSPTTESSAKKPLNKRIFFCKRSAKKLQLFLEVEKVVRVPRKRVATKRLRMSPPSSPIQIMELESRQREVGIDEKDQKIGDLQDWTSPM